MAADNQVIIEGIARFEALQRAVQSLVADAEGNLAKLGRNHPLVLDTAAASVQVDKVLAALRRTRDEAGAPRVLRVRTEDAEARVAALASQIKTASVAVTDFGPPDPFGKFRSSLNTAGAAVGDFVTRTTVGSKTFGQGFEGAATKSRLALESLQREIRDTAAAGSPVPPAVVAQVDRLETEYRQATTAAHQFRVAQAGVRAEIRSTTPPINDLTASVNRAAGAVKAFVVARAIQELGELGGASFTASEKLKAIHRQFESIFGDRAGEEFAFIRAETERLGLELETAASDYVKLASAAENTELKGQGIRRLFTQLSEGAIVARLSTNDYGLVLRAFGQIIGQTNLRLEEITQQLRDSLPQSYGIALEAAKRSGVAQDDFLDAVKGGLLESAEFARNFGDIWQEQIGKKVPEATASATAELGRLKTAEFEAKAAAGDELSPALADMAQDFRRLLVDSAPLIKLLGSIAGAFVFLARVGVGSATATRDAISGIAAAVSAAAAATQGNAPAFVAFFEVAKERIRHAREELDHLAGIARDDGAPALDLLAGAAGTAGDAADDAGEKFSFMQRKVAAGIKDVEKLAAALPAQGEVQQAVADKVVKAIDKQLVAIRSLPVAEQEAFKNRTAALEALRERLEVFTTAYEREQAKQAKAAEKQTKKEAAEFDKRNQQFLDFLVKQREIASGVEAPGESEAARALGAARTELEGIESKEFLDPEDLTRIDQLREQIRGLERDAQRAALGVREVGQSAADAAKQQQEALREFVAENEEFRAAFLELSPAAQSAVEALVSGFERALQAQGANVAETERFGQALAQLFTQGGELAQNFAERLSVATGTATGVGAAFDVLRSSVGAGNQALAETAPAATAAAGSLEAAAAAAGKFVAFSPNVIEGATAQGEGILRLSRAADEATRAQSGLVHQSEAVRDSSQEATAGIIAFGDKTVILEKQAGEAGGTLTRFGGEVIQLKGASEQAGEGLAKGAEGAASLADGVERLGPVASHAKEELSDLGEAASTAGSATAEGAKGVDDLGVAATAAVSPMGALAEQVKKVTGVDLPKFFGDTAEKVGEAAESAVDLADGVGKVGTAATENDDELGNLRDRGAEIADKWRAAAAAVGEFNERAGIAIGLCEDLEACLAGLAAS